MKYFYAKHFIDKSDITEVFKSLKQAILSQGKYKKKLENQIKKKFDVKYCLTVTNCTSGLHLAYISAGLKKNDYIITSPLTWSATISSANHIGAKIKLIDIDKNTLNLDIKKLKVFLKKTKIKPKIIIPVHYAGAPVDMIELNKICRKYKIKIIEDAAHAMGAKFNKSLVGNCRYSDAAVFSLQPSKPITSGEGGLLLTNNKNLYLKAKLLSKHGIEDKNKRFPWAQNIIQYGYNYKLPEMNCALALSQLKKLNKFNTKKEYLRRMYIKELSNIPGLEFQQILKNSSSSNHLFTVLLPKKINYKAKKNIFQKLKRKNIFLTLKYRPLNLNTAYKNKDKLLQSREFFRRGFNLPMSYSYEKKDIIFICKNFREILFNEIKKNNLN